MSAGEPRPIMVIAGASGVIGRHLIASAREAYDLRVLTRRAQAGAASGARLIPWHPQAAREGDGAALGRVAAALDGAHVLVNLAGASVANGRLDVAHQRLALESRLESTRTLLAAHRLCNRPPAVWFQASATGYYGDAGEAELSEASAPGKTFLAELCGAWEAAAEDANGARLLLGRIGIVLARDAPGWRRMLLPIRLFAGGPFGSGRQWWPWIDAGDLALAMRFVMEREESRGAYNFSAPAPVRQAELARRVARRLGRPAALAAPPFALRLALGGVADEVLLASQKARPRRLLEEGFAFCRPGLEDALDHLLARP